MSPTMGPYLIPAHLQRSPWLNQSRSTWGWDPLVTLHILRVAQAHPHLEDLQSRYIYHHRDHLHHPRRMGIYLRHSQCLPRGLGIHITFITRWEQQNQVQN